MTMNLGYTDKRMIYQQAEALHGLIDAATEMGRLFSGPSVEAADASEKLEKAVAAYLDVWPFAIAPESERIGVRAAEIRLGYWKGRARYAEKQEEELRSEILRLKRERDSRSTPT